MVFILNEVFKKRANSEVSVINLKIKQDNFDKITNAHVIKRKFIFLYVVLTNECINQ